MDNFVQWLILLLALLIGWLVGISGRTSSSSHRKSIPKGESPELKHRLQLLFDSYSDQTIDGFVQSLEVKPDTVEIHISIGRHFRKQGEVEKAILIHQNLMARPELTVDVADKIILELAIDYKVAGLYDRAEALLLQLAGSRNFREEGARLLLSVYQFEKEWEKALDLALTLDYKKTPVLASQISHYCCELGDVQAKVHDYIESRRWYLKAAKYERNNPRIHYSLACLHVSQGQYREAIEMLRKVVELAPSYIAITLPYFRICTVKTDTFEKYKDYLTGLLESTGQVCVLCELASIYNDAGDYDGTIQLLKPHLKKSGNIQLIKIFLQSIQENINTDDVIPELTCIKQVVDGIDSDNDSFTCVACGFVGSQIRWKCPSCNNWGTIRPAIEYVKT